MSSRSLIVTSVESAAQTPQLLVNWHCACKSIFKTLSMENIGPILIAEDDHDDILFLKQIFQELNYPIEVKYFNTGTSVLEYLYNTPIQPFLILADVNLPLMNGFELREKINENEILRMKSIPFIFLSTTGHVHAVNNAYKLTVQGYFQKGQNFEAIKKMIELIVNYWLLCKHPFR